MLSSSSSFLLPALVSLLSLVSSTNAQLDLTSTHNVTSLEGMWSTGSGAVTTGMGFVSPLNYSFTYPATTGMAYSFTGDGFFEESAYRFVSNASLPNCIQAVVYWQHGTYTLESNGSIVLTPFSADGRIQVQDPCAAVTNIITLYDQTVLYAGWGIQVDNVLALNALQLTRFDGAAMPPLYLRKKPGDMLPTVQLTGYGSGANDSDLARRSIDTGGFSLLKRSAAAQTVSTRSALVLGASVVGLVVFGVSL
ncbi:chaperone for protein-folding within the ER, fungal-domain-containing protein [Mrakia frigida]|uniref:Rot1p n=1 Tax=Mrakia frigida TaxID=29902 RepID=UPI003FCC2638